MEAWPSLPLAEWRDTYATLHMWTQIVGKTRLALSPIKNHCWQVALYVTPRGLTTGPMPHEERVLAVQFDFMRYGLVIETNDGGMRTIPLRPRAVADFYS